MQLHPSIKLISGFFVALCLWWLESGVAYADSLNSLTISPAILEFDLKAGDTQTRELTVFNKTAQPLPVKSFVMGLNSDELSDTPEARIRYDASHLVRVEPESFIIEVGKTTQVQIEVAAPDDLGPGGHYATVFFEVAALSELSQFQGSAVVPRVGALIFIDVAGERIEKVLLTDIQKEILAETGEINFNLTLKNYGNVHQLLQPELVIKSWPFGQKTYLVAEPRIVLPLNTKQMKLSWPEAPRLGVYQVNTWLSAADLRSAAPPASTLTLYVFNISLAQLLSAIGFSLLTAILIIASLNRRRVLSALRVLVKNS